MKPIRIFFRSISEAFKSVFRNFSLSLASISCISITLILVAVSVILSYNVNSFTSDIEKDVTIVVFVDNTATSEESDLIGKTINNIANVTEVYFQSKQDIKADMEAESDTFEAILKEYDAETNPLQDTYLVKVSDIEKIGDTAKEIKKIEKVELVKYGEGMVEELVNIFDIVKNITYIVVVALIVVTAFLISNTIKITIQNRKREIEIMRLVGASNSYIKIPFFFEGIILGFLGTVLPILICCFGYAYLYDILGGKLFTEIIKLVNPDLIIYNIVLITLLIGVVVGALGSYRAVRRHLKI
ncbi:MAG: permease-like cell division protein FtsX [Bacilli bacterium]|nr:permease-like cell division protein FtsX [Bacilli bacterium]